MADFIIIKQYVSLIVGADMTEKVYLKVWAKHNDKDPDARPEYTLTYQTIDRERAKRLIKEKGLVCTHSDRNGDIYDTPDKEFQNRYKKNVIIPSNIGL